MRRTNARQSRECSAHSACKIFSSRLWGCGEYVCGRLYGHKRSKINPDANLRMIPTLLLLYILAQSVLLFAFHSSFIINVSTCLTIPFQKDSKSDLRVVAKTLRQSIDQRVDGWRNMGEVTTTMLIGFDQAVVIQRHSITAGEVNTRKTHSWVMCPMHWWQTRTINVLTYSLSLTLTNSH